MKFTQAFSVQEVQLQTERLLKFQLFQNSPILSRFLQFIIEETIHAGEHQIKEYSIAINVLHRPHDFNPHDDAIVRIHAGRLRRVLKEYYLTQGLNDPIIISIPIGCYVPVFEKGIGLKPEQIKIAALPEPGEVPVVAIFPFRIIPQNPEMEEFSLVLREQLSAELSRFEDLSVIGYFSAEMIIKIQENILEAGKLADADYIVAGYLKLIDSEISVQVNILAVTTGEIVMTKSFNHIMPGNIFKIQNDIVQQVTCEIGGLYGIVFKELSKLAAKSFTAKDGIRGAIFSYYKYQRSYSVDNFREAIMQLESAVNDYPDHAICLAMLAELYFEGIGLEIETVADPLEEGYQCTLKALNYDPLCQQAWHSYAMAHLFRRDKEAVHTSAWQCINLNPNNSAVVSGAALMLICAGYFDEGFSVMEKSIKLNPCYPWWINAGFCFYFLYKKNYRNALFWSEKLNSAETFWDPLFKCVSLVYLDRKEEASKSLSGLLLLEPGNPDQIRNILSSFLLSEDLINLMMEGLELAGLGRSD